MTPAPWLGMISSGDPRSRSTWSATPANLLTALEALGVAVSGINARPTKFERMLAFVQHQGARFSSFTKSLGTHGAPLLGVLRNEQRSDYAWSDMHNSFAAKRAVAQATVIAPAPVLYMTPMALRSADHILQPQYAYIDSTFATLTKHSDGLNRFPRGYLEQVLARETQGLASCAAVFTAAQYVADDLVSRGVLPLERVHHVGIGLGRPRSSTVGQGREPRRLLFVARNSFRRKGGELALNAFESLQFRLPGVSLDMVVGERDRQRIKPMKNLHVYGDQISQAELAELFSSASLLLMPALNEPLGLVYLEALSCGVPVLGLNRNFIPELVEAACAITADATASSVAQAVVDLFSDGPAYEQMRLAALARAGDADWSRVAARIAAVMLPEFMANDEAVL